MVRPSKVSARIRFDRWLPASVLALRGYSSRTFTSDLMIGHVNEFSSIVILRLRNMTALDATGLRAIEDFSDALQKTGRSLLLCGAPPQPSRLMSKAEFHLHVGEKNILPNVETALARADEIWRGREGVA